MKLNYKKFGEGFPIVILHGLLGSLDNWQTIAKKLVSEQPQFATYIIDQRNHGRSPHTDEFSYEILTNDLLEFFEQHQIEKAHIIGHSMGGKVAMNFALTHPDRTEKLIVLDIAPVEYQDKHNLVFKSLYKADATHTTSRKAVEETLMHGLNDETTVQFLMKGLTRSEDESNPNFLWRFNLDSLDKNYAAISGGISLQKSFSGKTLFIKGDKSNYINADNYSVIEMLFPNNELTEIKDAGHWAHAEKPDEFLKVVEDFLLSTS